MNDNLIPVPEIQPPKRKRPWPTIVLLAVLAGAYILFPPDLLPDILPGLGQIDDVGVAIVTLIINTLLYRRGK